jgi:hypothetical protein
LAGKPEDPAGVPDRGGGWKKRVDRLKKNDTHTYSSYQQKWSVTCAVIPGTGGFD